MEKLLAGKPQFISGTSIEFLEAMHGYRLRNLHEFDKDIKVCPHFL